MAVKKTAQKPQQTSTIDSASGRHRGKADEAKCSKSLHKRTLFGFLGLGCVLIFIVLLAVIRLQRRGSETGVYSYRIVKQFDHDPTAFTQGLLWLNGSIYESTGLYGQSSVREVRLGRKGGARVVRKVVMDKEDFGEGLVHTKDGQLLQLLWRRGEGIRYKARPGKGGHLEVQEKRFQTPLSDGWGLEFDGESLIVTDSGPDLFFLDPETFDIKRTVRVTDGGRTVEMVNELELIDGELWANIFGTECIARISPATGRVLSWVVLQDLLDWQKARTTAQAQRRAPPDVFNGIAWDPTERRLFVTGKLWPTLFEIDVVASNSISISQARELCIPKHNIFRQDL